MKQFTVYAPDAGGEGGSAVYIVNFVESGAIAYPLVEGWSEVAERVERNINTRHFGAPPADPFAGRRGARN